MLDSWSSRIAAITAVCGGLYAAYKSLRAAFGRIMNISQRLQTISDQLVSNGGSSLRDAINRIEHRQIQTEQRERAFLHMHPDMMFELDRHLSLRWSNHAFLDTLDVDSSCVQNFGWHNLIVESERERVLEQFEDARQAVRNIITTATLVVGNNPESTINTAITGTVMEDSTQKTSGFLVTVKMMQSSRKFP